MANELAKFLNSQRRHRDELAVKKQVKIAKAHGLTTKDKVVKEPHRLAKHHVMDCGNSQCPLCGNPRRTHKDTLTAQEKRLYQDVEKTTDKHSNGLIPTEN
jgi:NADH:ubiquinone oxidoreductase subunit E